MEVQMTFTRQFDEIGRYDVALAGGKGANLGELSSAGLPVPAGFVVTTGAYDAFVEASGIKGEILALASRAEDPASFEAASEWIGALFFRSGFPEELAEEVRTAYEQMAREGQTAVAVRSSATAEDLPGASFAGQQQTFLNVRGQGAVLEAVKRCWASLWTARAMAYRRRQGTDPVSVSLAVVVQQMVHSDAAGVMFTANPANGRRDEAVINAAWGLGESVVSGSVTPDFTIVEKEGERVKSRDTADKEVRTVYTADGTGEQTVPEAWRRQAVLDDQAAAELVRYGTRIENLYGSPQDVEWALADGRLFILQARPVTNLSPPPLEDAHWEPPFPGSVWWRRQVVENLPEPLSPLFDELYVREGLELSIDAMMAFFGMTYLSVDDFIDRPIFATVNGYAYLRADYKLRWRTLPLFLRATIDEFRVMFGGETEAYWR
jgi:rifampicin phosphotransferase